jgi:hypothetical protein
MARHPVKPHRYWILLAVIAAAFGLWYVVGEFTWRHPETVSSNQGTVVQPTPEMQNGGTDPSR